MIRKSQWKFVATIMSILLFIFGVIYFGIHGFTENSVAKMASSNIENIVDTYKPFPNNPASSDIQPNGLIFFIEDKTLVCDTLAFSEDEINALYEKLNDDIPLSSIEKEGNVFYSIRQISGQKALIATSMRNYVKVINETRHNLLFAMILIYLILFLVVYLISFKVFAPIKNALEKQKQFISDASHELKTPITIISASTDVITGENNSQWVSNIKTQTDRLTTLVSDMLTLAKMDEKQVPLKIETFNLSNEILDTILPFEALAFEKNKNQRWRRNRQTEHGKKCRTLSTEQTEVRQN